MSALTLKQNTAAQHRFDRGAHLECSSIMLASLQDPLQNMREATCPMGDGDGWVLVCYDCGRGRAEVSWQFR